MSRCGDEGYSNVEMSWIWTYSSYTLWGTKCQQELLCLPTRDRDYRWLRGRFLREGGPHPLLHHDWQVYYIGWMSAALGGGGYKWVLTGIDTHSGFSFAFSVVDANAQNTVRGLKQKILYQFRLVSYISSEQETDFTLHSIQHSIVGKEISLQMDMPCCSSSSESRFNRELDQPTEKPAVLKGWR